MKGSIYIKPNLWAGGRNFIFKLKRSESNIGPYGGIRLISRYQVRLSSISWTPIRALILTLISCF